MLIRSAKTSISRRSERIAPKKTTGSMLGRPIGE